MIDRSLGYAVPVVKFEKFSVSVGCRIALFLLFLYVIGPENSCPFTLSSSWLLEMFPLL